MERKFEFSVDEFYHIYNRGNDKRDIFLDDKDKVRFIKLLFACNGHHPVIYKSIQELPLDSVDRGDPLTAIGAYCLMPNHFHILIKEIEEGGISKFIGKLLTSYSMYFNKKYSRTGRLFENTFKATHADSDEYLEYLFSYIHLNPIKLLDPEWKEKGIADPTEARAHLACYQYSSHQDYTGIKRPEAAILDRGAFPEYFETKKDFEIYINDWLNYQDAGGDSHS